jgi:hypothetical protein
MFKKGKESNNTLSSVLHQCCRKFIFIRNLHYNYLKEMFIVVEILCDERKYR